MNERRTRSDIDSEENPHRALLTRAFERRRRLRYHARGKAGRMCAYSAVLYGFILVYRELFSPPPQIVYRLATTAAVLCLLVAVALLLLSFIAGRLISTSAKLKYNRRTS